jgi:hypothetical protein
MDAHHYSAPNRLAGEQVDVRCSATSVEIFQRSFRTSAGAAATKEKPAFERRTGSPAEGLHGC